MLTGVGAAPSRTPKIPIVTTWSAVVFQVNTSQIVRCLWLMFRVLKYCLWWFWSILSSFIVTFFGKRICWPPHWALAGSSDHFNVHLHPVIQQRAQHIGKSCLKTVIIVWDYIYSCEKDKSPRVDVRGLIWDHMGFSLKFSQYTG